MLTASLSRMAGGLFWSVRSLSRSVKGTGCTVSVFATDDRHAREDIEQWRGLGPRLFSRLGPDAFAYAPGLSAALDGADLDILHTHGLWMYPSVASWCWARRHKRPLVISPRGMLDPWALGNAAWKKRLAAWLYENRHLHSAACLHALNDAEYHAIRVCGLRNPVAIIPNGIDLPPPATAFVQPEWAVGLPFGARAMLFLGRLHPKKGLVELLRGWALARKLEPDLAACWFLIVAGWDESGHEAGLRSLAAELDLNASVRFVGPQFGREKEASLARADAFVLPSHSEGLPMAVLEAWAHGLPVLMTPRCNLSEGFERGAAISADPRAASLAEGLVSVWSRSPAEMEGMGRRGRNLVEERFTWSSAAVRMRDVYAWCLGHGARPGWVILE